MPALADTLPLTETVAPADQGALAAAVAEAYQQGTAIYPIGGGTSLDYGLVPRQPGIGLRLDRLDSVIDYPARDMTITVEAGIRMNRLAETLAAERQWLPIDVPDVDKATLGGMVATAWSGPRRYGYGTPRDYVIGISAVDGRGMPFNGGGRVVKNVAGYDFCKLLTGSLGTLGVITQVTLKIRPMPEASAFLACDLRDWNSAEQLLAALVTSATTPVAIELLAGPHWRDHATLGLATAGTLARLAVALEGTRREVDWMLDQLTREWQGLGVTATHLLADERARSLWLDLTGFSAARAPLVTKASLLPGRTVDFVRSLLEVDSETSIQAHAGNGIVIARHPKFEAAGVSRALIGRLQPAAARAGGHLVVLSTTLEGLTRQAVWGGVGIDTPWMNRVKRQFDPKGLLNPGRFVYA